MADDCNDTTHDVCLSLPILSRIRPIPSVRTRGLN